VIHLPDVYKHGNETQPLGDQSLRSAAKAVTYRLAIIVLDVTFIYFLTGKFETALWFMVVSNVYTTFAYFAHERAWDKISWGRRVEPAKRKPALSKEKKVIPSFKRF